MTMMLTERPRPRRLARAPAGSVRRQRRLNLWIPLTPIFVLLLPQAVLSLPLVEAVILAGRIDPRAVSATLRTILALRGLDIDIDSPRARLRLRIF